MGEGSLHLVATYNHISFFESSAKLPVYQIIPQKNTAKKMLDKAETMVV